MNSGDNYLDAHRRNEPSGITPTCTPVKKVGLMLDFRIRY